MVVAWHLGFHVSSWSGGLQAHSEDGTIIGADTVLRGKAALDAQWRDMLRKFKATDCDVTLQDLEVFHVYKWLLDNDKQPVLSVWVKTVLEANAAKLTDASPVCPSKHGSPKGVKKPLKKEVKSTEQKSSLLGFF